MVSIQLLQFPLWISVIFAVGQGKSKEPDFRFFVDKFEFRPLERKYFKELNCKITQSPNRSYVGCTLIFGRWINKLAVDAQADIIKINNNQKMTLAKFHMDDACQFLTTKHKNPLLSIANKQLLYMTKGKFRCPIKPDYNYTFKNWYINENDYPSSIPSCKINLFLKYHIENKHALNFIFLGRLVHKK